MNKELILHTMTNSFKQANVRLAVENGMQEEQATEYINSMSESIAKCMSNVLDDLLDNFPNFIK